MNLTPLTDALSANQPLLTHLLALLLPLLLQYLQSRGYFSVPYLGNLLAGIAGAPTSATQPSINVQLLTDPAIPEPVRQAYLEWLKQPVIPAAPVAPPAK